MLRVRIALGGLASVVISLVSFTTIMRVGVYRVVRQSVGFVFISPVPIYLLLL